MPHSRLRPTPRAGPVRGLLCAAAWLWLAAAALVLAPAQAPLAASGQPAPVVMLQLQGAVGPATTEYLRRGLADADARRAAAVILRIDTPGGLASSMRDIVRAIIASPVPVIGYVAPGGAQAASAGTYILYACHVAAMAPGTNLGAATPVQMGGGGQADDNKQHKPGERADDQPEPPSRPDAHERKAVNDAAAFIRSLAELRGRNVEWAEEAVRGAASLAAREAQQQKVIDLVASDTQDLLNQAHGREVRANASIITLATRDASVIELQPDWRTRVLAVITDPNIAYILLLLGIYGILFEMMNPGAILPGALGAVALVTALFALNMLPVSYAGLGLVLLGIALMAAEAFTPTLGLLGAAGVALFAFGSLFLYDTQAADFSLSVPLVIGAAAASALLLFLIFFTALRAQRRRVVSGDSTQAGQPVEVLSWHGHSGLVRAGGETWQARSEAPLAPGQQAVIESRKGLVLVVRGPAPKQEKPA
ncbi:nodulation protein NfeD [Bordetella sp. BOR01]|uniref:NfeD family protein n=1 Tax=Bordetella sp. BOR01 TaxID=2854779 RepID=UPI001C484077|nr:nodulation protein NfeD [Bordetella sp. BOR01]MBV7486141.1 nodulation protein NfeD [Bordetella sp. BOR01]